MLNTNPNRIFAAHKKTSLRPPDQTAMRQQQRQLTARVYPILSWAECVRITSMQSHTPKFIEICVYCISRNMASRALLCDDNEAETLIERAAAAAALASANVLEEMYASGQQLKNESIFPFPARPYDRKWSKVVGVTCIILCTQSSSRLHLQKPENCRHSSRSISTAQLRAGWYASLNLCK